MLIQTKIIFQDEKQSELLGKTIIDTEDFVFDVADVKGIVRGGDDQQSIIFLGSEPVTIHVRYNELRQLWMESKGYSEKIITNERPNKER